MTPDYTARRSRRENSRWIDQLAVHRAEREQNCSLHESGELRANEWRQTNLNRPFGKFVYRHSFAP